MNSWGDVHTAEIRYQHTPGSRLGASMGGSSAVRSIGGKAHVSRVQGSRLTVQQAHLPAVLPTSPYRVASGSRSLTLVVGEFPGESRLLIPTNSIQSYAPHRYELHASSAEGELVRTYREAWNPGASTTRQRYRTSYRTSITDIFMKIGRVAWGGLLVAGLPNYLCCSRATTRPRGVSLHRVSLMDPSRVEWLQRDM